MNKIIPWIIVGALVVIILIISVKKFDCSKCYSNIDTITVYKTQIIENLVEIPVEVSIYNERVKYDTTYKDRLIDTAAIIKDYYERCMATWFSSDTIQDTTLIAIINDSIVGSMITYRQFLYGIKQFKEVTHTVTLNDNGIYLGGILGRSKNEFAFGGSILYKKENNIFGLNYDLLNKDIYVSYHRKLTFRK